VGVHVRREREQRLLRAGAPGPLQDRLRETVESGHTRAMAMDGSNVQLDLPSAPPSIKRARDAVAALAETVGAPAADVKLAVSEAVTNAVVHAFRDRPPGTI